MNGTMVGTHRGGFAHFRFDVTGTMIPGSDNVIAVMVSNTAVNDVPPLNADFTFFGGLYRFLSAPYPDGPNPYVQRIEQNLARLRQTVRL